MNKVLNFYTDGACTMSKNGGWAFYCSELNIAVCGNKPKSTNNEMELKAIGSVFKYLAQINVINYDITINSDSAWCIGSITNDWNVKYHVNYINRLKNVYKYLTQDKNNSITFKKVKGHSNIFENELCDYLAVTMSNKL